MRTVLPIDGDPKETRNEWAETTNYYQNGDIGSVGNSMLASSPSQNGLHLESYNSMKSLPQGKLEVQGQ